MIPFKTKQVEVIVLLCQKVAQNTCRISTTNLVSRQSKVNTFSEVPQLSDSVLRETPKK